MSESSAGPFGVAVHPKNADVAFAVQAGGAGAIAQVVVQIAPQLRDREGRFMTPLVAGGLLAGLAVMYLTGLLVSV